MWCNKQNVIFMEELNKETLLDELKKFVDVAPQINLYVPQYVQNRIEIFEPIYQNAIKLLQSTLHCKYFYLHKYEFIEYDKNNKPYFNNEKFKEEFNKILSKTSLSEEEKEEKINFYRQQLLCDTENFAMTDYNLAEYGLIITLDYNKNFILPEMTIFTELCYTFEKYRQNIIQPEYHFQNQHLQEIQQKSSDQVDENEIENKITVNVFAGLATLLNNIILSKNEDRKNVLHNVGNTTLYLMSFQSRKNGFYAYHNLIPAFFYQLNNIIKNCINGENQSVNYAVLYGYVKKSLRQESETVRNSTYETTQSILESNRKRPENDKKIIFGKAILGLIQDIASKTISLKQCKKRLEPIKAKISQDKSAILDKLATDLVEKYKTDVENVK